MMKTFLQLLRDDEGATSIEYALIAATVSVVILGAAAFLGTNIVVSIDYVATSVGSTTP